MGSTLTPARPTSIVVRADPDAATYRGAARFLGPCNELVVGACLRGSRSLSAPSRDGSSNGRETAYPSSTGIGAYSAAGSKDCRPDELEARREDRVPARARDGDDAVLDRLAERLKDGARELRQLVEEEDAAMRE
jgi:hypothetical protein